MSFGRLREENQELTKKVAMLTGHVKMLEMKDAEVCSLVIVNNQQNSTQKENYEEINHLTNLRRKRKARF